MRAGILVDRHHAGLLYSLQLLFEDRFNCDVYVPIGREWWDEGYWRFGEVFGDDRLAQQYLHNGTEEMYDTEFPDRLVRGVTVERFREMEWVATLASVQENQHGYNRLAQEVGAQSIYQMGNRSQRVDWDLDFVALVSAEAPIPEGRGVVYHQEFAKDTTFAPRPMSMGHDIVVRSFVNCFDRIPREYALFQRAMAAKPQFIWCVHGHDGYSGLVQPTTEVAKAMEQSGFGWHDKPQGDGFGHIIHYWAAIGRPLVGHASYYNGLMPGPLWEDGVTCIDLDLRTPEEAAELMWEIADDPYRHAAMGTAIRARLDALVDFDAEAEAIRRLLGW